MSNLPRVAVIRVDKTPGGWCVTRVWSTGYTDEQFFLSWQAAHDAACHHADTWPRARRINV